MRTIPQMDPTEQHVYSYLLFGGLAIGAIVFVTLLAITAPYGRHTRAGWGPSVGNTFGWTLMELPAAAAFAVFFLMGTGFDISPAWTFFLLWEIHYLHRSLVFPWRIRAANKRIPLLIVLFGITFNLWNTYLNGRYLGVHTTDFPAAWFAGPRFLAGLALFFGGMAINIHADHILIHLRPKGGTGYYIPHGGLYRWVSCPNYLGEIIEWLGWALATWSLPGLVFALWTMANLIPRARSHHQWYQATLHAYPRQRKAIIPFIF